MFGSIGMPELILIFIVALLVFGPKKLPEIGKSIGKGLSEFKRASDDLKRTIELEIEQGKQEVASVREHLAGVVPSAEATPSPAEVTTAAKAAADQSASAEATADQPIPAPPEAAAPAAPPPDSRPIEPS